MRNTLSWKYRAKHFLRQLGPGVITGASDDDPSGIGTYSQAGAQLGYGMLWTMLFSLPLMIGIQEICARIGRVTGRGIAGNIRECYPRKLLYPVVFLLLVANVFNLGADIGAMASAAQLLFGGHIRWYMFLFAIGSILLEVFIPYSRYVNYLKWMCLSLFAYVATVLTVSIPWGHVLRVTLIPPFSMNGNYLRVLIAVLGTTLSPYLFFWQASEEVEELESHKQKPIRLRPKSAARTLGDIDVDTRVGMGFSNLVAFFIILVTAATLHVSGITDIETAAQAAKALEPLAGKFAGFFFAIGIIGTGLLAIPVLAGSAAYAVGEALRFPVGLEKKPQQAKIFYAVITLATFSGFLMNFSSLNPMKALFLSAQLNGFIATPLMVVIMFLAENKKVMKHFTLTKKLKILGWLATAAMLLISLGTFFIP